MNDKSLANCSQTTGEQLASAVVKWSLRMLTLQGGEQSREGQAIGWGWSLGTQALEVGG